MSYEDLAVEAPRPVTFGPIAANDTDNSFGLDCTDSMTQRSDTIVGVGAPVISRADGATLTNQDLEITNVIYDATTFAWTCVGRGNSGVYYVTFPLQLQSGNVLNRTAQIPVMPMIG